MCYYSYHIILLFLFLFIRLSTQDCIYIQNVSNVYWSDSNNTLYPLIISNNETNSTNLLSGLISKQSEQEVIIIKLNNTLNEYENQLHNLTTIIQGLFNYINGHILGSINYTLELINSTVSNNINSINTKIDSLNTSILLLSNMQNYPNIVSYRSISSCNYVSTSTVLGSQIIIQPNQYCSGNITSSGNQLFVQSAGTYIITLSLSVPNADTSCGYNIDLQAINSYQSAYDRNGSTYFEVTVSISVYLTKADPIILYVGTNCPDRIISSSIYFNLI